MHNTNLKMLLPDIVSKLDVIDYWLHVIINKLLQ